MAARSGRCSMAISVISLLRRSPRNYCQLLLRPCGSQTSLRFYGRDSSQPLVMPKKPQSSYMAFYNEKRSSIMDANPGIRVTESSRIAGELWRHMDEEERKVYREKSRKIIEAYKVKKDQFLASLTPGQKQQLETDRKQKRQRRVATQRRAMLKELNKPSRGLISPFFCFTQSHKLDRGEAPIQQFTKGLAEHWKRMPVEEKEPFLAQSRTNMELYEAAMLAWEKEMIAEGRPELVRGYKPAKKTAKPPKKESTKKESPKEATKKKPSSPPKKSKSTQTDEAWMREE